MDYSLNELIDTLKTQGVLTIEGVFSEREMAEFRGYLDKTIEEASQVEAYKGRPTDKLLGRAKDTVWTLWELYGVCEEGLRFTRHPVILKMLEGVFGGPVVHASQGTMFDKVAGGDAKIGWHQDTFFIMDPPDWDAIELSDFRYQFGHVHVRPNQMEMTEDYYKKTLIVRINIDEQTVENGAMQVIPGSYLEGPFELRDDPDQAYADYMAEHESDAIHCTAGQGSVTFYYPTTLHSSTESQGAPGTHRCAAAHRMRACNLDIPGWNWPTDFEPGVVPAKPESGFDLNPTIE